MQCLSLSVPFAAYLTAQPPLTRGLYWHPLAERPIPLGRESVFGSHLPRVYALTMCMLFVSMGNSISSLTPRYSNISSNPWQEVLVESGLARKRLATSEACFLINAL